MPRRLFRDTRRRVLAGVAAGFGRYLDVDPTLVRLALLVLVLANGLGLLVYLAAWALIPAGDPGTPLAAAADPAATGREPARDAGAPLAEELRRALPGIEQARTTVGGVLVLLGAVLLAHNLGWFDWPRWANFRTLWPLLLVALGASLIAKARRSPSAAG